MWRSRVRTRPLHAPPTWVALSLKIVLSALLCPALLSSPLASFSLRAPRATTASALRRRERDGRGSPCARARHPAARHPAARARLHPTQVLYSTPPFSLSSCASLSYVTVVMSFNGSEVEGDV